ncbi:alpha/beta hydrolase domain-containing protein 14B-like [Tropilaelaps mercedesae]|uniref:Alpha/beta hydrolase domain-containing protein 14B-like n=1 Tax=Tropilaelaps mercedesae TaxID=418985 RepID=A0A1V9Y1A9_9ACAR|nr:alpha/beta hydrolase domain-containing protein 14B-like [Tropilaelaps mercedesae]
MIRIRLAITFAILSVTALTAVFLIESYSSGDDDLASKRYRRVAKKMDFKTADFSQPAIPREILDKVAAISVATMSVIVLDIPVHVLYTKRNGTNSTNVVLLHGQAYSSATWMELGTIQALGAMGHAVVAIDLPGYGKTPAKGRIDKAVFLEKLMLELSFRPQDTVIISPSMSGAYSLAFLNKHPNLLKGFVPVAPVNTESFRSPPSKACSDSSNKEKKDLITHPLLQRHAPWTLPDLSCYLTPTLVVFGERDSSEFLQGCALLNAMPRAGTHMIPNGRHAAYRDDPQLWHTLLYNFLAALQ